MNKRYYRIILFILLILMIPTDFAWAENLHGRTETTIREDAQLQEGKLIEDETVTVGDQLATEILPVSDPLTNSDFFWKQTGVIRYQLGYHWRLSRESGDDVAETAHTGLQQQFYIDLNGYLLRPGQDLSYTITLSPDDGLDGQFNWTHPWFTAQYGQGIRLRFPDIKLALANHQIDGFYLQTPNNEITAFAGKESYIPQSKRICITTPDENIYYLYDHGSAGDIVQNSELVLLDGVILTPQRDYSLNYLNGKLKLFVPLMEGMQLEVKYFFVLHNPDLIEARGEYLSGIVFNKNWLENSLSAFYMQRGKDLNKVGGFAGRISTGPLTFEGEWVLSRAAPLESWTEEAARVESSATNAEYMASAYDLRGNFSNDQIRITYELRNIDSTFQEIGVVPYLKGRSNLLDLHLRLDEGGFQWKTSQYIVETGKEERVNGEQLGILKCNLAPHHVVQWILQKKDAQWGDEMRSNTDFSIGYIFETRPLTLSLGQSIQTPEHHFAKLKINQTNLVVDGQYTVETLWNGKEHQVNLESTYRPIEGIELNSFLEYKHPFTAKRGNTLLQLNSTWNPTPAWSTTAGYVFSHHSSYHSSNQRYYLMANYQATGRHSNVYLEHSNLDSLSAHSTDTELNWKYGMTLFSHYQMNYQIQHNHFVERDKSLGQDLQASTQHLQNLAMQYNINDQSSVCANVGYDRQDLMSGDSWSNTVGYSGGVDFRYQFGEERIVLLGAHIRQGGRDAAIGLKSRVQYPIGKGKVDYLGDFSLPLERRGEKKTTLHLQLIGAPLWKVNPELRYEVESSQRGESKRWKEVYSGMFRYHWTEKRSIFLEARREFSANPNEVEENYSRFGLYTGIEILF